MSEEIKGRRQYYEQLKDHFKTKVPQLKYVGRYNSQRQHEDKEQPIGTPSLLIKMVPENFTDPGGGRGIQQFDLRITCFVDFVNFKDEGIDIYDLIDEVYIKGQLFVPVGDLWKQVGKLRRVGENEDNDHDQLQTHEMEFLVKIMDYSADIDRGKIQKTLTGDPAISIVDTLTTT